MLLLYHFNIKYFDFKVAQMIQNKNYRKYQFGPAFPKVWKFIDTHLGRVKALTNPEVRKPVYVHLISRLQFVFIQNPVSSCYSCWHSVELYPVSQTFGNTGSR